MVRTDFEKSSATGGRPGKPGFGGPSSGTYPAAQGQGCRDRGLGGPQFPLGSTRSNMLDYCKHAV